jgi:hypothetical protein
MLGNGGTEQGLVVPTVIITFLLLCHVRIKVKAGRYLPTLFQ